MYNYTRTKRWIYVDMSNVFLLSIPCILNFGDLDVHDGTHVTFIWPWNFEFTNILSSNYEPSDSQLDTLLLHHCLISAVLRHETRKISSHNFRISTILLHEMYKVLFYCMKEKYPMRYCMNQMCQLFNTETKDWS